jgi:hypothetical protein
MTHVKVEKEILQWEIKKITQPSSKKCLGFATHIPTNFFVIVKNIKVM